MRQVKRGYSDVMEEMFHDFILLVWWQLGRGKKRYPKGENSTET